MRTLHATITATAANVLIVLSAVTARRGRGLLVLYNLICLMQPKVLRGRGSSMLADDLIFKIFFLITKESL